MSVRPARRGDLAALAEIERRSFPDPWPLQLLALEIASAGSVTLVSQRDDGSVVAYAAFRHGAGEAELLRAAVVPEERRQGHARRLLREGLAHLTRAGIGPCFLEVRPDNLAARRLYESEGFVAVGRRLRYYRDGTDALVYRRESEGAAG